MKKRTKTLTYLAALMNVTCYIPRAEATNENGADILSHEAITHFIGFHEIEQAIQENDLMKLGVALNTFSKNFAQLSGVSRYFHEEYPSILPQIKNVLSDYIGKFPSNSEKEIDAFIGSLKKDFSSHSKQQLLYQLIAPDTLKNFKGVLNKRLATALHDLEPFENILLLINLGADVNIQNSYRSTPLLWAAMMGDHDLIKVLIKAGAGVNAKDSNGNTPLLWAATSGDSDIIQTLIEAGADVNAKNENSDTPLFWAATSGDSDIVQALIAAGADVNAKNENSGIIPLHCAAIIGHLRIVQVLIAAGADVNAKDDNSYTALLWAKNNGHDDLVEYLQNQGVASSSSGS